MPKPTLENRRYFKSILKRYRDKFTSPVQTCQLSDIEDIFTEFSPELTDQEIKVLLFEGTDYDEPLDIETELTANTLVYFPASKGDYVNLRLNDLDYQLFFPEEDGGVIFDENTYELDDTFTVGTKEFTIKALGGVLVEVQDGPSYTITESTNLINEGETITFTIETTGLENGTILYYTISGNIQSNDFSDNSLSGSVVINNNSAVITKTLIVDDEYEDFEFFYLELRTNSISGSIVAESPFIDVIDVEPAEPEYSVTASTTLFKEGESITFTTTAENVASGTELFYTISGSVSANDFVQNTLSGSFAVIDFGSGTSTGTVTKTAILDLVTEGNETFVFQVRTGSTSGTIVATSSTITIQDTIPTFIIVPTVNSINEGQSVTFNVTTTDIPNQTEIFFTTIGTVTASDFSDNSLSGSFTILDFGGSNGVGALTRNTVFDFISEQNKNFQIQLRLNSISGPIVGTSTTIAVNNISASYAITPSSNIINEGQSVTFTISTNVPNGTVLYYTTLGDVSASEFSDNALSGSVTISNQTATIVKTTLRDRKTEGDEQFAIQLRLNSVTGNIVATSSFVKIKDTSRNVGENANSLTFGPIQVNRDNGNTQLATDWYNICNIDELPPGSKIALFIDISGSMTQSTIQASYDLFVSKLAEKNISIITVTNSNEDWITPFLTELN